jgi:hypothetical protein
MKNISDPMVVHQSTMLYNLYDKQMISLVSILTLLGLLSLIRSLRSTSPQMSSQVSRER